MRRSKAVSAIALFAAASMVLGACGSGSDSSSGGGANQQNQKPGEIGGEDKVYKRPQVPDIGTITTVTEENFHDFNNLIGATNNASNLLMTVATLPSPYIGVFENGQFQQQIDGDLMESVKVTSTNPQVVEYKFQKAAVWDDGAPIGCKDIYLQFLTRGKDTGKKFDSSTAGYEDIKEVKCSEDLKTATVSFDKPVADYRGLFSFTNNDALLPAHIVEKQTGIADLTKLTRSSPELLADKVVKFYTEGWLGWKKEIAPSAGPFKIESTDLRDELVLVRNDKYWGAKSGPAKVIVRTNTNAQSASQQLQNKEVQSVDVQADGPTAIQLKNIPSVKVFAQGGQTYEHIDFNMSRPLFKDNPEIRKAVATCIDRNAIVDNLVKDIDPNAKPLSNFVFMPNEAGYEEHYNGIGEGKVADAKKLLEEKGWTLGTDGVYAKGGTRAEFTLGYKTVDRRHKTWQLVSQKCKEAGIQINSGQKDQFNADDLPASAFDAALFAWVGGLTKSSAFQNYQTKEKGGNANYNLYSNPEVDRIWAEANSNLDFAARTKQLNEVDKLMAADLHSIPLFQLPDFTASDSSIGVMSPDGKVGDISYLNFQGGQTWNLWAWVKR
nr:ABC transporter family substrate-binding protein [Kibdelosporangium sp. MJ126-NF4]CEL19042.1 Oligopeptide ABC transporter, periplasmic oligopeptide-binding protein OppA (TC 3.A.1.5.1) [Kibdelosporangium sp. MJ126-NF4]CTQ95156.1 Oligopeptide ABC transporter, periplasmic oligopeptide-binding protein OppA (TC 3.A.1.5.1) [Kibdelosporangium sp. MJ126-NF4]